MGLTRLLMATIASCLTGYGAMAQIPVEVFAGHQRTTLDVMFFKFFKNAKEQNSRFLFFNRNRASVDYRQTTREYLPQFGFTEAVSYNHPAWKGFAPVVVAQISNRGTYPKAGIQYAHLTKQFTFFSWVVVETLNNPNLDWFLLTRYEPWLNTKLHLFSQIELFTVVPTAEEVNYNFVQRARLGLHIKRTEFGVGADFTTTGKSNFIHTHNSGVFFRHEF